jgi:hypothetical protein
MKLNEENENYFQIIILRYTCELHKKLYLHNNTEFKDNNINAAVPKTTTTDCCKQLPFMVACGISHLFKLIPCFYVTGGLFTASII